MVTLVRRSLHNRKHKAANQAGLVVAFDPVLFTQLPLLLQFLRSQWLRRIVLEVGFRGRSSGGLKIRVQERILDFLGETILAVDIPRRDALAVDIVVLEHQFERLGPH